MNRRELLKVLSGGVASIPAVDSVQRLEVGPKDTIILKYKDYLPRNSVARIHASMEANFPGHKIIVLDAGADLQILKSRE